MTTSYDNEPSPYDTDEPTPAASIESERALLGAVMLTDTVLDEVSATITPDDFYRPMHGVIWQTFLDMRTAGRPIDPLTVFEELRNDPHFLRGGGSRSAGVYLLDLTHACPTAANAPYYAGIVAEKASLRRLITAGHSIWQIGYDGAGADLDELHARARDLVDAAAVRRAAEIPLLVDVIDNYVDGLDTPPPGVVQTPWPELDDVLNGGLLKGELVVVAARPGVGKSIIGLSCARAAAQLDIPTIVFSLEMPKEEVLARLVADTATVPLRHLIRHELDIDDHARVLRCADRIRDWPLAIHDTPSITVAEISAICRERVRRHNLGLVVIDQLNLITTTGPKNASRQEQVSTMSRQLTVLAKELGIPIVLLHQLNRGPEQRANNRPVMADLRETGQIEADAHKVLLLWRPEDEPGNLTVIVAKNRNGRTAEIPLSFSGHYARARSGDFERLM